MTRLTDLTSVRGNEEHGADGSYEPAPSASWWKLTGDQRAQALARLRAWVEQIYRPGFGHLAAALGPCWDQHPPCLYGLDWLMELWSLAAHRVGRQAPYGELKRRTARHPHSAWLEKRKINRHRQPGCFVH